MNSTKEQFYQNVTHNKGNKLEEELIFIVTNQS